MPGGGDIGFSEYPRMLRAGGPRLAWSVFREVHWFDLMNRTRTSGVVDPSEFGLERVPSGTVVYMASWTSVIRHQFRECREILGDDFARATFLDIGCGRGKVVLVWQAECRASGVAQRVVGVDFSPVLLADARRNAARMGASAIEFVEADATALRPDAFGQPLVIYLYNPFSAATLARVLALLGDRAAAIIYCNPQHGDIVRAAGFRVARETCGWHANLNSLLFVPA